MSDFTMGQRVRSVGNATYAHSRQVLTYIRRVCQVEGVSIVRDDGGEYHLVLDNWLVPAEPVTTTEEAARYERVERVLDALHDDVPRLSLTPELWFEPNNRLFPSREAFAAVFLDLMERGEL